MFAQRKGITKRKRGKEVWDEEAGDYKRRFGYKRAGDESEMPIIEAAASDQASSCIFLRTASQRPKPCHPLASHDFCQKNLQSAGHKCKRCW